MTSGGQRSRRRSSAGSATTCRGHGLRSGQDPLPRELQPSIGTPRRRPPATGTRSARVSHRGRLHQTRLRCTSTSGPASTTSFATWPYPPWHERRHLRHLVPQVPHPRGDSGGRGPRRYAWEDGEVCEYPRGQRSPSCAAQRSSFICRSGSCGRRPRMSSPRTGTGSCRTGSPCSGESPVVRPGRVVTTRPRSGALLRASCATLAPAPRHPSCGRRGPNHSAGLAAGICLDWLNPDHLRLRTCRHR